MDIKMRKIHNGIFELIMVLLLTSCGYESNIVRRDSIAVVTDTISCEQIWGEPEHGVLTVWKDVDLEDKQCRLPKGVTIIFQGGVIKNGTLVGNETRIESTGVCFDRVRILGTWDVPDISTAMFRDLDYENSLKDVVALSNTKVNNRIVIEKGDYQVSTLPTDPVCLRIYGKTEFILDGTIRLVPNDYSHYYILQVDGDNIEIKGRGSIIGDKHTHTGTTGEWGMGIELRHAHNVTITGVTIKDCWGDCIYVGGKSTNILIENCLLDHGRRQGISITSADGVTIKDCTITNVNGTNPEYGIDVEPNNGDVVDHVTIDNVTVRDCKGGFEVYGWAADAWVGKVTISNCDVSADKKITIAADKCDTLIVENCDITQHNTWGCVTCTEVGHVEIKNNTFRYDKGLVARFKDWMRPKFGKKRVKVMEIDGCKSSSIKNNREQNL